MKDPQRAEFLEFDVRQLAAAHPPVWKHQLKQQVYDYVRAQSELPPHTLEYSRWIGVELPAVLKLHPIEIEVVGDVYSYDASGNADWHVNFADPNLFVAYGSGLLAQDELQVLEHPILGSLRESLIASGRVARTREGNCATPVLIRRAPRQCALDLFPDLEMGRPCGLYGNEFQKADWRLVQSAITVLQPPSETNLICISAPTGSGYYTTSQIQYTLEAASGGMRSAMIESRERIAVHTGFWGCGAFGGSRPLMSILQILAAQMVGIGRLAFYAGSQAEVIPFENGRSILRRILNRLGTEFALGELQNALLAERFAWGVSDGN